MAQKDDFEAKIAAIRSSYLLDSVPEQIQSIHDGFNEFMAADKSTNVLDALAPLHAASHKFAGSSGTFGLADASGAARVLSEFTDQGGPVNEDNYEQYIDEIRFMVEAVQQAVNDADIQ